MKPSMYFFHEQNIRSLTDEERLRLLVGKIRKDELEKYSEHKGKLPKEKLKSYYVRLMNGLKNLPERLRRYLIVHYTSVFLAVASILAIARAIP